MWKLAPYETDQGQRGKGKKGNRKEIKDNIWKESLGRKRKKIKRARGNG